MLLSFSLIFILGLAFGWLCEKIKLPKLLGMIIVGIILGPYSLNLLDKNLLLISADLRKLALIIVLTRAGLNLDLEELKKVGRPAFLLCFVPALFEIGGCVLLASKILGLTVLESAILGSVTSAVSPAVIVPKMLSLKEKGYGTKKSIPQMIMAGASVDDVFVIVLFTAFTALAKDNTFSVLALFKIPTSIISGLIVGWIIGIALNQYFKKVNIDESIKILIILSISFILVTIENSVSDAFGFSGLLAIMSLSIAINKKNKPLAKNISLKYSTLWIWAEILLFVLVGATVDITYALSLGALPFILLLFILAIRMVGVILCTLKTQLNIKESLFTAISYCPKATVQAAIGSTPLSMGLSCGNTVLCVAVIAILITAPLGAFFIDLSYKKLLEKNNKS